MPVRINGATSGSTTIAAPDTGSDETIVLSTALASKLDLAGGKILQIVRTTDGQLRTTTSTTFTDVTGVNVTITPQRNTSKILIIAAIWAGAQGVGSGHRARYQITTSGNTELSGAQDVYWGSANSATQAQGYLTIIGYHEPATTSATTYKLRFATTNALSTADVAGSITTTQMYAIEVSA